MDVLVCFEASCWADALSRYGWLNCSQVSELPYVQIWGKSRCAILRKRGIVNVRYKKKWNEVGGGGCLSIIMIRILFCAERSTYMQKYNVWNRIAFYFKTYVKHVSTVCYGMFWKITHQNPSVLCTPPFEKSPIIPHRFCVLPPLKNRPSKPIGFVHSPLWKITHQSPSVLCTPPFEKSLFLVGVYLGGGRLFWLIWYLFHFDL